MILTEFIEQLGYEDPTELANWITGILKDKEKRAFKNMLIEKDPILHREGKTKISRDAKILVDNLCILKQFMKLFPKNCDEDNPQLFMPYRILINPNERKNQLNDPARLKSRTMRNILLQKEMLTNLDAFLKITASKISIDITKDSLREFFEKYTDKNIELKDSFAISKIAEIGELKEKLEKNPHDISAAKKLAAKYVVIGENDEAVELLEPLLKKVPDDSEANAVLSLSRFNMMAEKYREFRKLRHLDDEPFIDSPVNAVEQYQKELYENRYLEYDRFRKLFIDSCFKTISSWKISKEMVFYEFDEKIEELGVTKGWFLYQFISAQNPLEISGEKNDSIIFLKELYLNNILSSVSFGIEVNTGYSYPINSVQMKLFEIFNFSELLTKKEKHSFNKLLTDKIKQFPENWLYYFINGTDAYNLKMFLGEKAFRSTLSFLKRFEINKIKRLCDPTTLHFI